MSANMDNDGNAKCSVSRHHRDLIPGLAHLVKSVSDEDGISIESVLSLIPDEIKLMKSIDSPEMTIDLLEMGFLPEVED